MLVMHIYQSGYSPDQICPNLLEMRFEKMHRTEKIHRESRGASNKVVLSGEVSSHRLVS